MLECGSPQKPPQSGASLTVRCTPASLATRLPCHPRATNDWLFQVRFLNRPEVAGRSARAAQLLIAIMEDCGWPAVPNTEFSTRKRVSGGSDESGLARNEIVESSLQAGVGKNRSVRPWRSSLAAPGTAEFDERASRGAFPVANSELIASKSRLGTSASIAVKSLPRTTVRSSNRRGERSAA